MTRAAFDRARDAACRLHHLSRDLSDFADWPDEVPFATRPENPIAAAAALPADRMLATFGDYTEIRDAFAAVARRAMWRNTYRDADIGDGFNANFGCYELIGRNGHFSCDWYGGFVVYAKPGLWYPWHAHPAEELYVVIAGAAEFLAAGRAPVRLGPGGSSFHASAQPHAMRTSDLPVLCYVAWRGDMSAAPRLSAQGAA